jgi:probable phosphoglycerate mutase
VRIWLVRHAETAWTGARYCGRADPPLTAAGAARAAALGARLRAVIPDAAEVWSSPAVRARETAAAIGRAVHVDARLHEVDVGELDGRTFDEIAARHPDLARRLSSADPMIDWPGGERWKALEERAAAAWDALVRRGRDAVVVSHGGTIRAILRQVTGDDRAVGPCEAVLLAGPPWVRE